MKIKIYLLPGTMCNENIWIKLKPFFDDRYELIHVPIPKKDNLDAHADALNEYFKEERVCLLGFSLGGYIASYFAYKYPHKIKKLFVISSSLSLLPNVEIEKRKNSITFVDTYGFKGLSRKKVISLLEESNQKDEVLIKLIQQMYIDLGKETFKVQMLSTLYREDLLEKFLELKFPVTFFYCDKDRLVNHEWLELFSEKSQDIKFIKKLSTSHMVPLEKPFELSEAIKEWL